LSLHQHYSTGVRGSHLFTVVLEALLFNDLEFIKCMDSSYGQNEARQIIWPEVKLQYYVGDLDHPVHMTNASDGSNRLFVVEQIGRIRIIQNNQLLSIPFLDISDQVRSPWSDPGGGGEEGLLSVAFPNNYVQDNQFTSITPISMVITLSPDFQ
jgi:hypothetical protein